MVRAALLVGATWTTLSFLFCLAWGRALTELPARNCARRRRFRSAGPGVNACCGLEPAVCLLSQASPLRARRHFEFGNVHFNRE
jgi:hypothetical protein